MHHFCYILLGQWDTGPTPDPAGPTLGRGGEGLVGMEISSRSWHGNFQPKLARVSNGVGQLDVLSERDG